MQDSIASKAYQMLVEWAELAKGLAAAHARAESSAMDLPVGLLGGVSCTGLRGDARAVVDSLRDGWRPIIVEPCIRSLAHVPWLPELDSIMDMMGFVADESDGKLTVLMVCSYLDECLLVCA
jgi:hypothetical protein